MTRGQRWRLCRSIEGFIILVIFLFPVYWMVNAALQNSQSSADITLIPHDFSFALFHTAFEEQGANLVTSCVVAIGATLVCLIIATPSAYALAHMHIRYNGILMFAILISQMVPGIVIANALYSAYGSLGLLNTHIGLILADAALGIPFCVLIIRAFMLTIPRPVIEAAKVDGASGLRTFVQVIIPMARNGIITGGLFAFLFAWSDFLFALTLTTTPDVRPITLGIYQYLGAHVSNWGAVMAAAVLASIPAALLLIGAQKYLSVGVTGGSVK